MGSLISLIECLGSEVGKAKDTYCHHGRGAARPCRLPRNQTSGHHQELGSGLAGSPYQ